MHRRMIVPLLVVALVAALVPAAMAAGPPPPDKTSGLSGVSALAANSAPVDAFETDDFIYGVTVMFDWYALQDLSDVMPRWAIDIPGWGLGPWSQARTIDTANATTWDEDWYHLSVSSTDTADWTQLSYRFDAFSMDPDVDLVIDVYGMGVSPAFADSLSGVDSLAIASNDDSPWVSSSMYGVYGTCASVTFIPPSPGNYWVRVRPYHHVATGFAGHAGAYTFRAKYGQIERIAGADRIRTAAAIAQEGWPTQPAKSVETTAVIAYSQNYPDALAAASLAGVCGSPVLLNGADSLSPVVASEIARLGFKYAYIIGGPATIKPAVEAELKGILGSANVKRVYGADRYQTSIQVLRETKAVSAQISVPMKRVAFLASGTNFPDALALGPVSYYNRAPILLTNPTTLNTSVASELAMQGIQDVIIAGGTGAVSSDVQSAVEDLGIPSNRILRIAGADRYETAKEIAAWACDLKGPGPRLNNAIGTVNNPSALLALWDASRNAYASGMNYPDALAGGAFAGKAAAPILLTRKDSDPVILFGADGEIPPGSTTWFTDLWVNSMTPIRESYLLGGTAAVSNSTLSVLDNNTGFVGGP